MSVSIDGTHLCRIDFLCHVICWKTITCENHKLWYFKVQSWRIRNGIEIMGKHLYRGCKSVENPWIYEDLHTKNMHIFYTDGHGQSANDSCTENSHAGRFRLMYAHAIFSFKNRNCIEWCLFCFHSYVKYKKFIVPVMLCHWYL